MHCRPLQLEAGACGQPRSACWRRRRQLERPRAPSRRNRRGPTPGKLCKAVQGTNVVCVGAQAARWAQGCHHVGSLCSGVCGRLYGFGRVYMCAWQPFSRSQPPAWCSACGEPAGAVSMQRCTHAAQIPMHEQTSAVLQPGLVQHASTEASNMRLSCCAAEFCCQRQSSGRPTTAWKQSDNHRAHPHCPESCRYEHSFCAAGCSRRRQCQKTPFSSQEPPPGIPTIRHRHTTHVSLPPRRWSVNSRPATGQYAPGQAV